MTVIKAKFFVSNTTAPEGSTAGKVNLSAVCRGVENSLWSQATPCGSIEMHIKNDAAFEPFAVGDEYEVLFRKVTKPQHGDGHPPIPVLSQQGWYLCETCGMYLGHEAGKISDEKIALHHETYDRAEEPADA